MCVQKTDKTNKGLPGNKIVRKKIIDRKYQKHSISRYVCSFSIENYIQHEQCGKKVIHAYTAKSYYSQIWF